ncbi:Rpn family recombination-promoting nuclease/putative transposase [Oceanirhabdus seepicola]|uniref:Rpn family recombination-promoting nuclease/putative transposase n=1 Tax=Oceanirhabdus seepicola TaxID=2828781 RepID=A0A9J6NWB5_9CLOT|nr:Rpn family recombination-promoting nuclease/putative transposase [Oceanirhabdus seepicola]MCM1988791.1 Rpn family recombination-promoting nuclease/putative transposase [Oceanirhabdus seepicola]
MKEVMTMENKLMNPMVDFAFKELFGSDEKESKIILKSLINAIIKPPEGKEIVEIVHLNPYNNKKYQDDKLSIMDLKVRNQDDELFDIEVQINEMNDFRKRSLYYWSRLYGETISNAGKYINLKKCVVISLLDFKLFKENDNYHNIFKVRHVKINNKSKIRSIFCKIRRVGFR